MLVLTRKQGETIDLIIGDKIVSVTVAYIGVQYGKLQARLAFDAPADVKIVRREINKEFNGNGNERACFNERVNGIVR